MPGLLVLSLGAALLLADDIGAEEAARAAGELRVEIRALETLRRCAPDLPQAEWMLHGARFLERDRAAFEARRAAILTEQREAFRRFLTEDVADRGFSPEVERAAAAANEKMKDLQEAWDLRVARIASAVREVLSREQDDAAEGRTESRGSDPNRPPTTLEDVQGLLLRVRMLADVDYRRREGQLAGMALRSPGARKDATRDEVLAAFHRWRAAAEDDLPRLRDEIVKDLFPGVRARELQRQVAVLRQRTDEPPGRLGELLESRVAVPALEALVERLRKGKKDPEAGEGTVTEPKPRTPPDDRKDRRQ
jgi:hypothetical protein